MRQIKRDEKELRRIVARFERRFRKEARDIIRILLRALRRGVPVEQAVRRLGEVYNMDDLDAALFEAACSGYGILPQDVPQAQRAAWGAALAKSWNTDGMRLSKRLHGGSKAMREAIITTVKTEMKAGNTWRQAARKLYDGYGYGHVIKGDGLPKYMEEAIAAIRSDPLLMNQATKKALRQIEQLSQHGAPTVPLRVAYRKLVAAAETGVDKKLEKAIYQAVNEKSRYIADRIARTEIARAYGDGFFLRVKQNPNIVAVRWKLSRRHPKRDICDLYANADLFGLGKGVYPKDKAPTYPAHPHCLCDLSEIVVGDVDMDQEHEQVAQGGEEYLKRLKPHELESILGVDGAKRWKAGADWQDFLKVKLRRPETRL